MIPSFVLHNSASTERDAVVDELVKKTGATQFQSYLLDDKVMGCLESHLGVAKLAKALHPTSDYLVFEDDCELFDGWEQMRDVSGIDVVYIGYTDRCEWATFGTHAVKLSPKARDKVLELAHEVGKTTHAKFAYDQVLSKICRQEGLSVAMPKYEMREQFAKQKRGLVSLITGRPRY